MLLLAEKIDYSRVIYGSIRPETWVLVGVCFFIVLFSVFSYFIIKRADPLKKPRGLMFLLESFVSSVDKMVTNLVGKTSISLAPYFGLIIILLPICFLSGLFALPTPINNYSTPFTFALCTFVLIQATAIKYNGVYGWFKSKFLSPFFIFFPINCIAIFSPLLSLSFRIFGNALAGSVIMKIIYWSTGLLNKMAIKIDFNIIGAVVAAPLHLYFDLFGAFIQTMVFVMLTAVFISLEKPAEEEKNT